MGDLEPDSSGIPVELEVTINGTAYRVLAERLSRERAFGEASVKVTGRGKGGVLHAPYAATKNFANTANRTAQQLMADALQVNGVPIGWSVDWGITDWLAPAGVWSHQGTYISALNTIAEAAGAYLQPHRTAQTIRVGEHSRKMTIDEVMLSDPDIIIMMPCGFDTKRTITECTKSLSSDPKWQNLRAVKNHNTYAVDANSYFSKPSIRIITGMEILAKIIHPEQFSTLETPNGAFTKI